MLKHLIAYTKLGVQTMQQHVTCVEGTQILCVVRGQMVNEVARVKHTNHTGRKITFAPSGAIMTEP